MKSEQKLTFLPSFHFLPIIATFLEELSRVIIGGNVVFRWLGSHFAHLSQVVVAVAAELLFVLGRGVVPASAPTLMVQRGGARGWGCNSGQTSG